MTITSRFFVETTSTLLIVGLIALLGIIGTTYWLGGRAQIYFDDVIAARDARSVAAELRNALQTAESSQRGFLVTGNEIYLAPYDTAKVLARRHLDAFKLKFAPFEPLAPLVGRLTDVIGDKFVEMDETIRLKRARQDQEAGAVFRTNRGKALMDEANVLFSGAIGAADARLTSSVTEHRDNASWLRWFSIIGGIVIVGVVGAAATAGYRYTRAISAARDEVSLLNQGLEARVTERTADLGRVNDEVQRFAYIVTHDLRAPLVNIMGFTSELESGLMTLQAVLRHPGTGNDYPSLAEEGRLAANVDLPEAIGFIKSSTRKMDSLINAILRISREGKRSLRPETVDLQQVINGSVEAVSHQLAAANGLIEVAVAVPPILSDRLSLEQIFGNIFDNALKYRHKDRPLRVSVRGKAVSGDRVAIDVIDNGRGIAEQDLERIFELFRRAGVQDQPGEGIGLTYVRTVVRNLGGDVVVESKLGEGTTFSLVLPRTLQIAEGGSAVSNEAKPVTIVLIEDDLGHARLIEKNIRRAGVNNEILQFGDGSSSLAYLFGQDGTAEVNAHRHLLVLLDLNLPDMTGVDILGRIKGNPHLKRSPVVVLTTTDDSREIQRCYDLGANVYITKPVNYESFANAIRQLGLFLSVIQIPETA